MRKGTHQEIDKREFPRLEKTLPVKFGLSDRLTLPRSFEALSRNISEGGVFIESDLVQDESLALDKDVVLNLEIELLGQAQRIKARAEIAWISRKSRSPQKKRSGFGVRFVQITPEEKRAISLFISKEMSGQTKVIKIKKEISVISREQKLTDRHHRNLEILDVIRKNRLISRAEISKRTGINIVTVSNYIDTYLKKGLVFERGLDISTGGRRPELVEVNPDYGYVIGVDFGPLNGASTSMQVVATDFTSRLLKKTCEKKTVEGIEDSLGALKGLIGQVLAAEQVEREKIKGIGIGISGIMDKFGGTVHNSFTGATFANYVTIKRELEDEFSLPVFIKNSASCALFGEKWSGISLEAKAAENIIYIFSDSQCAIMLKGELYTGSSNSAGRMKPSFDYIPRLESRDLAEASAEAVEDEATKLGAKITYLVDVFNPQVVIIGRHFSQLGDAFLDTVRRTVNRWAFKENANIIRIIPDTLGEDAVAQGAASLVIEAVFVNI